MRTRLLLVVALLASLTLFAAPATQANHSPRVEYGYIPVAEATPDATTLHYKLLLPDADKFGPGPYPLVVDYSGYMPGIYIYDSLDHHFLGHGYAVAGVNMRGTGCSGGKFDYFEPRQRKDGAEAIDWLGRHPQINGKVAMVGKSYPGITPLFVAAEQPKHLTAIVPGHVFGDLYRDVPYPGGILNATFAAGWSAGRITDQVTQFTDYRDRFTPDEQCLRNQADHAPNPVFNPFVKAVQPQNHFDGPLYHERSPFYFAQKITAPTLLVQSWQDEQVGSRATNLTERFHRDTYWRLLASNGDHGEYYGPEMLDDIVEFLHVFMKGTDEDRAAYKAQPRVVINWENGSAGGRRTVPNSERRYAAWPPSHQQVWRLPLGADGVLGSGTAGTVDYTYAPGVGSQQRGGFQLRKEVPAASWSDRPAQGTSASFTTPALDADKVLLGSASVDLWVSSTAADTDFEVTLSEVRPDGQEMFVQQGWLRASHRKENPALSNPLRPFQTHLATDARPLVPLEATPVRIEVFPFGHIFRAGSKLRITVAAPHVKPDLWGFAALPTPARNTIHIGPSTPSSVALPLLAGETAPTPLPPCTLRNQPCRAEQ